MFTRKINKNFLNDINSHSVLDYFGDWVNNIDRLKTQFSNAEPFENIVIENFLSADYIEKIYEEFPTNYDNWHQYCNPLEVKYSFDDINKLNDNIKSYFYFLSTNEIINIFCKIANIENLEYDEYLHGAGLHCLPRYGRLNVHLDYEKHPLSGKERKLNIILFLNKEWKPDWKGENELWNDDLSKCIKKTAVKFNTAIIFKTNDISWHGIHDKIMCPEDVFRKSLAYYYVSPLSNSRDEDKTQYRKKATFSQIKSEEYSENMNKLHEIRKNRLITNDDIQELFPLWDKNK